MTNSFDIVTEFENKVSEFFGAPYGVAVDSCTHGLEICIRYTKPKELFIPTRTYLSVAMLPNKLHIPFNWVDRDWNEYYWISPEVVDAAVLWRRNSYIPNTFMVLSFQYQKHLKLGRGGMILLDNKKDAEILTKMSYDGRERGIPWRNQNIDMLGYHYYMTPEVAKEGLDKLSEAINTTPKKWSVEDWPNLRELKVFK